MIQAALILILIFSPIARGAVRPWAFMPIYLLTFLLFGLCVLKALSSKEIRIKRTPLDIPLLAAMALSFVTVFNSGYIYGSIMEIIKWGQLAMIFYITVNCVKSEEDIKKTLNAVLALAAVISLFGILQYIGMLDKSWWGNSKFLSATYVNHNHFAGYLELTIPMCVGMVLVEKDAWKRALYTYVFLVLSAAFLLSMSRGGWFSLSIAMAFMSWSLFKKGRARFIFLMSALFLATSVIFISNAVDLSVLFKRILSYKELDFSGRLDIWKGTIAMIKDHFLLGTGPGTFIYNFPKYRPMGLNVFVNYAHHDYLQIASEMGIFMIAMIFFMLYSIIKKGLTTHGIASSRFKVWMSFALTAGVLSLAIHGFGDFNFYIPANAILFSVYAGLIFNISSGRERQAPEIVLMPGTHKYRLVKYSGLTALMALIIFISSSFASEIYLSCSEKAMLKDDLKKAERCAVSAARINPFNYKAFDKLGAIYRNYGESVSQKAPNFKRSEENYKKALNLNPIDGWAWIGLADAYNDFFRYSLRGGDFIKKASFAYKKALKLDPQNTYFLKRYAMFLLNTGEEKLSSDFYKKAAFIMSKSKTLSWMTSRLTRGESFRDMADMAFQAQDFEKALAFYKMAGEMMEDNESARLGEARSYLKTGLLKEAVYKYADMPSSARNKAIMLAALGDYYLSRGGLVLAKKLAEKSSGLFTENPEAYNLMYKIRRQSGTGSQALPLISRILSFNSMPFTFDYRDGWLEISFNVHDILITRKSNLETDIVLPAGIYELNLKAKTMVENAAFPHMIIKVNNKEIREAYVTDMNWKDYKGLVVVDYPVNRLEISCADNKAKESGELYIDDIVLRPLY